VKRREFIAGLSGAAAWPVVARAQQPIKPVVGILTSSQPLGSWASFFEGLKEAGFVDGQNVTVEIHSAEGQYDRLPTMAADLVRHNVNVIVATGAVSVPLAAKTATTTIPIVFMIGSDPIQWGLVSSLNRPGGNITGMTIFDVALTPKRLELIREVIPSAKVIGLLLNPNNPNAQSQVTELDKLIRTAGLTLRVITIQTEPDLATAFDRLVQDHVDAVLIASDALLGGLSAQIAALAERHRVPVIYPFPVPAGLMTYGISLKDMFHQLGRYTGRILKGEKPADLPVMQPTKVELTINLKTAKVLGLTFPLSLLGRADEVIE
jgi:putative tryptophan/tyrosine transport system substrate-binding protein